MKKEKPTTKVCKHCKTEIPYGAKICPQCRKKQGMGMFPKVVIGLVVIGAIGIAFGGNGSDNSVDTVPAVSATEISSAEPKAETSTIEPVEAQTSIAEQATAGTEASVPTEYKSALKKAKTYSDMMYMSKAGIYNQLTSEFGEQFTPEAAQYAIDNLDTDWNINALEKAKTYSETMHMSKAAIYDQLISEHGEAFTESEAQYAIDNIEADWNSNALEKAKVYQDTMSMSPAAIRDQLVSEYGEKFTAEEADYAIEHLE